MVLQHEGTSHLFSFGGGREGGSTPNAWNINGTPCAFKLWVEPDIDVLYLISINDNATDMMTTGYYGRFFSDHILLRLCVSFTLQIQFHREISCNAPIDPYHFTMSRFRTCYCKLSRYYIFQSGFYSGSNEPSYVLQQKDRIIRIFLGFIIYNRYKYNLFSTEDLPLKSRPNCNSYIHVFNYMQQVSEPTQ